MTDLRNWIKRNRTIILSGAGAIFIGVVAWIFSLYFQITDVIKDQWFLPPLEIYSAPQRIQSGQKVASEELILLFRKLGWRERAPDQKLLPGDYSTWSQETCSSFVDSGFDPDLKKCLVFFMPETPANPSQIYLLAFSTTNQVLELLAGDPFARIDSVTLPPDLFAQFYGDQPIIRRLTNISETPLQCLQAVTAIEDSRFLEHGGVSLISIARAMFRNISAGRLAEGGSTITQQLVKNYFLTAEKSFFRKIKEAIMSILLEAVFSKDEILSAYLNVIYMGQNGPFQIRGFGAASEYYFGQKLESLGLGECSLLAAIVNSPGRFNPFNHKERAEERRNLVLKRMTELGMIQAEDAEKSRVTKWPEQPPKALSEPAPYYVDAVKKELNKLGFAEQTGLKVYTGLQIRAQEAAYQAARKGLEQLEKQPHLQKLKAAGKNLEAMIVSLDLSTGAVIALVGGRSYRVTQFNRAIDAHRQVGSLMKPLVYLTALESETPEGKPYTPMTIIKDEPIEVKSGDQMWKPKNYDGTSFGPIPLFFGLQSSLNQATVRLGMDVGLGNVIETARRCGISSDMNEVPSLTLGAFELYPFEVLQCYSTIARNGLSKPVFIIDHIDDFNNQPMYARSNDQEQVFSQETSAVLVSLLRQVVLHGTGKSIPSWRGFTHPAAGKTGTTSDNKDAWFAGFTPYVLTVAWVGYDDNTTHGLTGSSGAIPLWTAFMNTVATQYPPDEFKYPEEQSEKVGVSSGEIRALLPTLKDEDYKDYEFIFVKGTR